MVGESNGDRLLLANFVLWYIDVGRVAWSTVEGGRARLAHLHRKVYEDVAQSTLSQEQSSEHTSTTCCIKIHHLCETDRYPATTSALTGSWSKHKGGVTKKNLPATLSEWVRGVQCTYCSFHCFEARGAIRPNLSVILKHIQDQCMIEICK